MSVDLAPTHGMSTFALQLRRFRQNRLAMASVVVEVEKGRVAVARVAVGACSPVAQRLPALEQALIGAPFDAHLGERVAASHLAPLSPIDDVRGSAGYRSDAALVLLRRLLTKVAA